MLNMPLPGSHFLNPWRHSDPEERASQHDVTRKRVMVSPYPTFGKALMMGQEGSQMFASAQGSVRIAADTKPAHMAD